MTRASHASFRLKQISVDRHSKTGESAVLSFLKMRLHEDDPREDQLHEIQSVGAAPLGGLLVETLCGEEKPSA